VFVALDIQHAMRMRQIVTCALPCSTVFFPRYLINGTILGKKLLNLEYLFRVFLHLLFETFFILRRSERDMIKNVYWSARKIPFIVARF
jgi:hypothetical protein